MFLQHVESSQIEHLGQKYIEKLFSDLTQLFSKFSQQLGNKQNNSRFQIVLVNNIINLI